MSEQLRSCGRIVSVPSPMTRLSPRPAANHPSESHVCPAPPPAPACAPAPETPCPAGICSQVTTTRLLPALRKLGLMVSRGIQEWSEGLLRQSPDKSPRLPSLVLAALLRDFHLEGSWQGLLSALLHSLAKDQLFPKLIVSLARTFLLMKELNCRT